MDAIQVQLPRSGDRRWVPGLDGAVGLLSQQQHLLSPEQQCCLGVACTQAGLSDADIAPESTLFAILSRLGARADVDELADRLLYLETAEDWRLDDDRYGGIAKVVPDVSRRNPAATLYAINDASEHGTTGEPISDEARVELLNLVARDFGIEFTLGPKEDA
jgi:hypothetical protein